MPKHKVMVKYNLPVMIKGIYEADTPEQAAGMLVEDDYAHSHQRLYIDWCKTWVTDTKAYDLDNDCEEIDIDHNFDFTDDARIALYDPATGEYTPLVESDMWSYNVNGEIKLHKQEEK